MATLQLNPINAPAAVELVADLGAVCAR